MQAANIRRNEALLAQLKSIGEACAKEGVQVVALKGAAELLKPYSTNPGHRYISDLDLLVAENDIEIVKEVLIDLGGEQDTKDDEVPNYFHHVPAFFSEDWLAQVELHRRLGTGVTDRIIPSERVLQNATPSGNTGVLIPSPEDRLIHLVAHGQINPKRHQRRIFSLRDFMDLELMNGAPGHPTTSVVRGHFETGQASEVFDGICSVTQSLFRSPSSREHFSKAMGRPRTFTLRALRFAAGNGKPLVFAVLCSWSAREI